MIRIGQACSSENFTAWGVPGNQRRTAAGYDGELEIRSWFGDWECVYRAKDADIAERIAFACEKIVESPNVGYAQYNGSYPRTGLYDQLVSNGWKFGSLKPCNTDCSALVATCVTYAGIVVDRNMYTGNQDALLMATGKFVKFTDADHTKTAANLRRGDILLRKGHTAICLDDAVPKTEPYVTYNCVAVNMRTGKGTEFKAFAQIKGAEIVDVVGIDGTWADCVYNARRGFVSTKYLRKYFDETYTVTAKLPLRVDAGTNNKKLVTIPKGTVVESTGEYKLVNLRPWYKCRYKGYVGYCSSKSLK